MSSPRSQIQPNLLTIGIQPDGGIALRFSAKVPSNAQMSVCTANMDFGYELAFGKSSANGYQRLLLDTMLGDQTLFSHRDGVETNWVLYTRSSRPGQQKTGSLSNYFDGSWGAEYGGQLLKNDDCAWRNDLGRKP